MVISTCAARNDGIPHGTAQADEWGFKWAKRFCEAVGTVVMRPRAVLDATDALCEVWFAILMLVWVSQMIKPANRRKRAGYGQGLPTSALLALYGYRRVQRDCDRHLPDLTEARRVLKGLCMRYKQRWGEEAFIPNRKQPYSTAHLLAIVAILANGAAQLATWPAVLCKATLTAFCYAISTGVRKDEWTLTFVGDTFVKRANFVWVDEQGQELPSTANTTQTRSNGCLLRGRSAASKCDRLNIEWGSKDMWFRYDDANPLNFAWRWRQWEEAYPCPAHMRTTWPAFSPSGDAEPFSAGKANACLNALLHMVMTPIEAAKRSWHSCRVTLATRLFAKRDGEIKRDEVEAIIQALARWKTPESVRTYARMTSKQYADYVDMATNPDHIMGAGPPDSDMCEIDPEHVVSGEDGLEDTIAALDAEFAREARDKRKESEGATDRTAGDKSKGKKRKATPKSGGINATAEKEDSAPRTYDIGDGRSITHAGDDSWGLVSQRVDMHNSLWGEHLDENGEELPRTGRSTCTVVAYAGRHTFAEGSVSNHTYVIEYNGQHYAARHTAVLDAVTNPATRRQLRNMPPPRVVR